MATAESTKAVVQQGFDSLNDRDRETFADLHTEETVLHIFGEEFRGTDAIVANQFGLFEAFPDFRYTTDTILVDGDMAAARWTATGTHEGMFEGIEPTGETVEFTVMGMFHVEDDHLTEVWIQVDQLGLLQQLGVVDAPGG